MNTTQHTHSESNFNYAKIDCYMAKARHERAQAATNLLKSIGQSLGVPLHLGPQGAAEK